MYAQERGARGSLPGILSARQSRYLPGQADQFCSFVLPTLCVSSLGPLAEEDLQLLSWVILHTEVKAISAGDSNFSGVSKSLGLHHFTVHTVPDGQQLWYYTSRAAVLIWVLPLEFRITTNFMGARTSLSHTATRASGTSFMCALVSSLLYLDFFCLTFDKA